MIVTLAPNPAVDQTILVDRLTIDEVNRFRESQLDPVGKGIKTSLDTDGEPLRLGVEDSSYVIKPNLSEAEHLLGRPLPDPPAMVQGAIKLAHRASLSSLYQRALREQSASKAKRHGGQSRQTWSDPVQWGREIPLSPDWLWRWPEDKTSRMGCGEESPQERRLQ